MMGEGRALEEVPVVMVHVVEEVPVEVEASVVVPEEVLVVMVLVEASNRLYLISF